MKCGVFFAQLLFPSLDKLQSPDIFAPNEYAWLVAVYVRREGELTGALLKTEFTLIRTAIAVAQAG